MESDAITEDPLSSSLVKAMCRRHVYFCPSSPLGSRFVHLDREVEKGVTERTSAATILYRTCPRTIAGIVPAVSCKFLVIAAD